MTTSIIVWLLQDTIQCYVIFEKERGNGQPYAMINKFMYY